MGAGILPVSFNGVCMVFLLGKEQNNQWSDFGGSPSNLNEQPINTAIREGYEELSGLLGTEKELRQKVKKNLILSYNSNRYTTFMFNIDYDENLPLYFNRNYNFVRNTTPNIIKHKNNGLYEKKEIKWFTIDEIYKLELRPFYKDVIYNILNESNLKKITPR